MWLLLELTYRCPLQCVFCYNPIDFAKVEDELTTEEWLRVLREARALGSVQLGLSGGEPLVRDDVEEIAAEAHRLGYYTNLITSGVGLSRERLAELKRVGLDHIQLSFQDSTREMNDFLSHTRTFELKKRCAEWIKSHGYPMVVNCVIHRLNIDHLDTIIDMAVQMGADYLELANTQYYSWAHLNREHLLPSREQLQRAGADHARVARAHEREDEDLLRRAGLLRTATEAMREWLGNDARDHCAGWRGAALSHGQDVAGVEFSECSRVRA